MDKGLVYVGDFKQLIPMGYEFSRLFARNYICYHQEDVWIWRKGKEVEIGDLYSKSYLLMEYLIEHNFTMSNKFNMVVINTETNQIEEYEREKHSDLYFYDKLSEEEMNQFYKRYRQKFIPQERIDCLKNSMSWDLFRYNKKLKVKNGI